MDWLLINFLNFNQFKEPMKKRKKSLLELVKFKKLTPAQQGKIFDFYFCLVRSMNHFAGENLKVFSEAFVRFS